MSEAGAPDACWRSKPRRRSLSALRRFAEPLFSSFLTPSRDSPSHERKRIQIYSEKPARRRRAAKSFIERCGYLVSNDDRFLEPFNDAKKNFATAWNELKRLTCDNPAQRRRLDEIKKSFRWLVRGCCEKEIPLVKTGQAAEASLRGVRRGQNFNGQSAGVCQRDD